MEEKLIKLNTAAPKREKHILLVDDKWVFLEFLRQVLEKHNYNVTIIFNSTEAYERICETPEQFDLLITDQIMPNLTGLQLAPVRVG